MNDIKTFVFMGRPGAGKGAQATRLSEKTGFPIFATGGRYRELAAKNDHLGGLVKKIMETGELMPDWFSAFLFEDVLLPLSPEQGIIFDGLGRKEFEARLFDEVCRWLGRSYKVIFLETREEVVRERLLKRSSEGRADDAEEAVHVRFQAYERDTAPAINFFESLGLVERINGEPAQDEVWKQISNCLGYAD